MGQIVAQNREAPKVYRTISRPSRSRAYGSLSRHQAATIAAAVSFILIGVGGVARGPSGVAPVGIAVITAYLAISTVTYLKQEQDAM